MPATPTDRELLLAQGFFYHVTRSDAWDEIKTKGLTASLNPVYQSYFHGPVIFLCTDEGLPCAKEMFRTGFNDDPPRVVLEVPAEPVAMHECTPDFSFTVRVPSNMTLRECLASVGFIVCYGDIRAEHVRLRQYQDNDLNWQDAAQKPPG